MLEDSIVFYSKMGGGIAPATAGSGRGARARHARGGRNAVQAVAQLEGLRGPIEEKLYICAAEVECAGLVYAEELSKGAEEEPLALKARPKGRTLADWGLFSVAVSRALDTHMLPGARRLALPTRAMQGGGAGGGGGRVGRVSRRVLSEDATASAVRGSRSGGAGRAKGESPRAGRRGRRGENPCYFAYVGLQV